MVFIPSLGLAVSAVEVVDLLRLHEAGDFECFKPPNSLGSSQLHH